MEWDCDLIRRYHQKSAKISGQALSQLSKGDIVEVKAMGKPPGGPGHGRHGTPNAITIFMGGNIGHSDPQMVASLSDNIGCSTLPLR